MASSSSSSFSTSTIHKSFKYDIFLSFRGEDTRKNFVDHLYAALQRLGIRTFKDDKRLKKGKRIDIELIKSIEESKIFIIVFSKTYASSSWCLDELVKIMECHKSTEQTAFPVFYDVEPSEVRKQHGPVGEAFSKHKNEEAAQKWRDALKEAADLAGWELKNTADGHEAIFIQKIVEGISLELRSINSSIHEKLVGMDTRIEDVESILGIGSDDVRMIGIKGIGGGGKTTLARAVFDRISIQFEGKSFVANVREVSKDSSSGLKSLQKQILSDVLNEKGIEVSNVHDGKNMMGNMMWGRKVLVVLDDVDHMDQLEALAGASNWFKPGSRIIITTRDEQVLVAHGVKWIRDVNLLSHKEALLLFSRYAFGRDIPNREFENLLVEAIRYAAGLPLTIKVLGSFLCGKNELEWIDALERLKTIPLKETLEKLELSYKSLEDDYKEIFLDVACILKGWHKDDAIRMLESCGFRATNGLRVLEQKSLITISIFGTLGMHDHIEEMGKNIVRRLHPDEPSRHSRLWILEEIADVLADDSVGTEATRCIDLELTHKIDVAGLGNMEKLRCLIIYFTEHSVKNDEVNFPNALRYLSLDSYPFNSLPRIFQPNNLVALHMPFSRMEQLWEGGERKVLNKLRFLDLSHSWLKKLDLELTPNLERLHLRGCGKLVELHAPFGCLKRLIFLELGGCLKFLSVLFIRRLESLKVFSSSLELHLIDESPVYEENEGCCQITCFYKERPSLIGKLQKFLSLNIDSCIRIQLFSGTINGLHHLRVLKFGEGITEVPEDIDHLECLEELCLSSARVKHLPNSICRLKHLKSLKLKSCESLESLPDDIGDLECLEKLSLSHTNIKQLPDSMSMLKHLKSLKIEDHDELWNLPEDLGRLECLEELTLATSHDIQLPSSIVMLKHLKSLNLSCQLIEKLPEDIGQLECLEQLILEGCMNLQDIPDSICKMKHLEYLSLSLCFEVQKLPEELGSLKCLKELNIESTRISHLPQSIFLLKGLCIVGDREFLQSCGFTSEIQTSDDETFCYISYVNNTHTWPAAELGGSKRLRISEIH